MDVGAALTQLGRGTQRAAGGLDRTLRQRLDLEDEVRDADQHSVPRAPTFRCADLEVEVDFRRVVVAKCDLVTFHAGRDVAPGRLD